MFSWQITTLNKLTANEKLSKMPELRGARACCRNTYSVTSDIKHSQQLITSFHYNPHVYFSMWHKWNTNTKRSEHYRTFLSSGAGCKHEILLHSLLLAKNDRGVFGVRVALALADPVIPLAFGGSLSIHVATFFCYTIRFASVPVAVARQQCVICPVELVICLSVKS